ncbi:MAG: hypothetical protein KZQ77_03885 [Candidatus Thiodiazotropha sp. (ex Notomyrtea botanica)]|nr:hypothetical protein [Candidatus Thiodiazotropha sp. (ex Notomyrtea botanica)]
MEQVSISAFSIRRLNPFNGVLQVFQNDTARALSSNGTVWEIQVLSDKPQGLWANMPFSGQQFYTFGLWSPEHGLKQVPINPLFNIPDMIVSTEELIAGLREAQDKLPFPLTDVYESWLMDEQTQQPIALLMSCRSEKERQQREIAKWIASEPGDFSFVSPHLSERGLTCDDGYNPRVHASVLEAVVRERAGQHHPSNWFHRHPDGSATPCETHDLPLDTDFFPELPLTESWEDDQEYALVNDYLNWKAPQLLMLPYLSKTTRDRLEKLAVNQAEVVDRLWRLYPEIHNHGLLKSARVEAKLRTANRN